MSINPVQSDEAADESIIILQSLLCLLRERNILSRGDIEMLCDKVKTRAAETVQQPLPCRHQVASKAATIMTELTDYIGTRYGGKRRRF